MQMLVSGMFFFLKPGDPDGYEHKHLVEAWEKVLVTSGGTDYEQTSEKIWSQQKSQ